MSLQALQMRSFSHLQRRLSTPIYKSTTTPIGMIRPVLSQNRKYLSSASLLPTEINNTLLTEHTKKLNVYNCMQHVCRLSYRSRSLKLSDSNIFTTSPISKQFDFISNRCKNVYTPLQTQHYSTMTNQISNEPRELKIRVPFGHIAGKVWNERAPVAVLCLHGWQDNAGTFDLLAPQLPDHLCLVAIDFPGHGSSSHTPLGYAGNHADYIVCIDRVLKHYGWKQVIMLGHSLGGAMSMLYAGTRPSFVHSIIMMDLIKPLHTASASQPESTEFALNVMMKTEQKIMNGTRPEYTYDELLQRALKSHGGSLDERGIRTLLKRGSTQLPNGRYSFTYDLKIRNPNLSSMSLEQQMAFAGRLTCRMMILKAEDGPYYEEKKYYDQILDKYRSSASEFVFLTVPGTHHTHLNTPENVVPHIKDFLSLERLKGFTNNRTEGDESVVTIADRDNNQTQLGEKL